jgi:hypothetical protein
LVLVIELGQRNSSLLIWNCLYGEHCYGFPSMALSISCGNSAIW